VAEKSFGFGIIGCGVIAPTHCRAIRELPNARLVAVCDIEADKARALGERFQAEPMTDIAAMLKRDDIDVVSVLTWSGTHAEIGMEAARAGKHVIVTKPIDTKLSQIDHLIETCRQASVKLGATHQFRSYGAYRRLKQAIDEGRLGRLWLGNGFLKWWRAQEYYDSAAWRGTWNLDGGGALMNQAIHYVDMLQWLMGPVTRLRGFIATQNHRIEVEDCASVTLHFANGALGTLQGATCIHRGLPARIEVHGERGNVVIEDDCIRLWDVEGEEREEESATTNTGSSANPGSGLDTAHTAHVEQIGDVLSAIEEDRDPILNGAEARKAVELILAVYQSAWRSETVHLPLTQELAPPATL
jgi:UDP-N-acetyl-2-amino-2-deoxyglucuronate dehydrogenase